MIMVHNGREMLDECIESVELHTPIEHEFVIVDDASEPAFISSDFPKNTTLVRMPRRSNCCNLRNVGMEMSKTEYVLWLDSDVVVSEGWYKPLLDKALSDPKIGLVGQPMDSRLVRRPFLPLTQSDCMCEYQFAYDYNHANGECDYITSYCVLVKKEAYRPTFCYNMPTPLLDPDLGASIKANGYKVVVSNINLPIFHKGTGTPRPGGNNYHFYLSRNFTRWFQFWEPHASKIFELYKNIPCIFSHNQNEPLRASSLGTHGDKDRDYDQIPERYLYTEL